MTFPLKFGRVALSGSALLLGGCTVIYLLFENSCPELFRDCPDTFYNTFCDGANRVSQTTTFSAVRCTPTSTSSSVPDSMCKDMSIQPPSQSRGTPGSPDPCAKRMSRAMGHSPLELKPILLP